MSLVANLRSVPPAPPPNVATAPDAERALVGAVVGDGTAALPVLRPHLEPEHLHDRALRACYEAGLAVEARGEPVNIITVSEELRAAGNMGHLVFNGQEAFIAELATDGRIYVDQPSVLLHFVALVRRAATSRQAAEILARQQAALQRDDLAAAARHASELQRLAKGPRAPGPAPRPAAPQEEGDWRTRLQRDGRRGLRRTVANLCLIFAHDPAWAGRLGYNAFREQVECLEPPPWPDDVAPQSGSAAGPWKDEDDVRAVAWLEREHDVSAGSSTVSSAVLVASQRQRCYHPVRDYLDSLRWDGAARLELLFPYYFRAGEGPYERAVSRWWAISAVARVYQPGCQADSMVVIEGAQGARKSSGLAVLAVQREWFLDSPVLIGERDGFEILRGKWIVEFAELASWSRVDKNKLKGYLTQRSDSYRGAYARRSSDHLRQCVFSGTTNEHVYLDDPSGGRRIWPMACGAVRLEELRAHRDQLWAEAVHLYQQGAHWWPETPEEVELCREQQQARTHGGDEWEPLISGWLAEMPPVDVEAIQKQGLTIGLVLERLLKVPRERWTRGQEMRVGDILRQLGYMRRRAGAGTRPYIYERAAE